MKWIGQHIWSFITRFRNKVYFEDLEPLAETTALVVDADGKVGTNSLSGGGGSLPAGGTDFQVLRKVSNTNYDVEWDYADRVTIEVRFDEAVSKGDPLYVTGFNNGQNRVTVAKADASDANKMPSIGLASDNYSVNDNGQATTVGNLDDVNTQVAPNEFQEGDVLYVKAGGGLTNVKPTGTNLIQNVGKVSRRQQNNGEVVVMAIGRSNDVPNLPTGKFFIGSATNTQESTYTLPTADGAVNQVLQTNGAGALSFNSITEATGNELENVVEDTTPQLGGNLDLNSNNITGTGDVDITGTLGLTNTTTGDSLLITTTNDSSDAAPVITLKRNSSSVSNGDYLGQLKFKGENDADQELVYAKVTGKISDYTDTTEDGLIEFALRKAGSLNIGARLTSTDLKLINGTGLEIGGYTFPTSDGTSGQVLQTNGSGTLSFQTPSSGGANSVVLASTTTQVRLNTNDNYYMGNNDFGWNYVIWQDNAGFSTTITDADAIMGVIIPKDLTTLKFMSTVNRTNGTGTNATVELFTTNRPNGSTSNLTLTSIGSSSSGGLSTGVVYNVDISLTGLSLNEGDLLFVALKKTGGTNTTTYVHFNYTIIGS